MSSLVPRLPLHAHIYCVTFDPHEELQSFMWVKGHAIDVRMWGEPGNEAIYMSMFGINSQLSLSLSLSLCPEHWWIAESQRIVPIPGMINSK